MAYNLDQVLASQTTCGCTRGGTKCFRLTAAPNEPICWPCQAGNDQYHGYGSGPLAPEFAATEDHHLGICIMQTAAWVRLQPGRLPNILAYWLERELQKQRER